MPSLSNGISCYLYYSNDHPILPPAPGQQQHRRQLAIWLPGTFTSTRAISSQVLIPGTGATFPKGFSPGQSFRPPIQLPPRLFGQRSKCAKMSSLWSFPPFPYFPPLGFLHQLRGFFTRCSMMSYLPSLPPSPVFPCGISPTSQKVCPQVVFHQLAHFCSPK